jgi:hypothetical protein
MKSDLSKVEVGDKIWTIQHGWTEVVSIDNSDTYPIETKSYTYAFSGKRWERDEHPSAFTEYPFKEQPIEKDTLVWFRDTENASWMVGYYSHFENGKHRCFEYSRKSTETNETTHWNIVTTENPLS